MDPETVVSDQTESGKALIDALTNAGFEVRIAFWAKPTEAGKWYLYLVSPFVDEKGPAVAYRTVLELLRQLPELWIDPMEIKLVGLNDSLATAALGVVMSNSIQRNSKSYSRKIRLGESTLGGFAFDGAYFYPLVQPVAK
ncbi:hypothetical protein BH10PLA2_BH10PLA2_34320 [soil metagenome]